MSVVFVCAMPPPVHGQAVMNEFIASLVRLEGIGCTVLDISPGRYTGIRYHLARLLRVLFACFRMVTIRTSRAYNCYFVYESGYGVLYNYILALMARMLSTHVFLHHHTSAHCFVRARQFELLLSILGSKVTHICLSDSMRDCLVDLYDISSMVVVAGNAFSVPAVPAVGRRQPLSPIRIGMLSNLTVEKGVVVLIECVERLHTIGVAVELVLAGPIQSKEISARLASLRPDFCTKVSCIGPVFGKSKDEFFRGIDVFAFPSKYKFEAQPIVVLEAMSYGLPCFVSSVGFLSEIVADNEHLASDDEDFFQKLSHQVISWEKSPTLYTRKCEESLKRFNSLRMTSKASLQSLCQEF